MTLEEIATQVLNLREAELLVLYVPGMLDDVALSSLRRQLTQLVPDDVRKRASVVVLREGMRLDQLTDADLKRVGLQRVQVVT